jgi:hypothetical protein
MKYILDIVSPDHDFLANLQTLISQGGPLLSLKDMGFPDNWKHLGVWKDVLFLASRLYTLDRYYDVYSFIIESEPDRRYGYIPRILNNPTFKTRFGTQYDESAIKKIILTMDKSLPK